HEVVAQVVALLHGGPEGIGVGIPMDPDRIAQARSKNDLAAAVEVGLENGRAARIFARRIVGARADSHVDLLAGAIDQKAPGPVMGIDPLHGYDFRALARGHRLGVIWVALERVRLAYIEVAVQVGESVRLIHSLDVLFAFLVVYEVTRRIWTTPGISK